MGNGDDSDSHGSNLRSYMEWAIYVALKIAYVKGKKPPFTIPFEIGPFEDEYKFATVNSVVSAKKLIRIAADNYVQEKFSGFKIIKEASDPMVLASRR